MAEKPASIHWQIAERILWHVRLANTNEEAVRKAAEEYQRVTLTPDDITKIAAALDQQSAQYQPAGFWYGLLWGSFTGNLQRGIPVEGALKMPTWGWGLLIVGVGFALLWNRR